MQCELPRKTARWWGSQKTIAWYEAAKARECLCALHVPFNWPKDRRKEHHANGPARRLEKNRRIISARTKALRERLLKERQEQQP